MIKVLIADDHRIFVQGVSSLLNRSEDISVVGNAYNGEDVLEKLKSMDVDVVLMDITMPKMDGLTATKLIKEKFPNTKVLIFSMHQEEQYVKSLLEAGATGYILKSADYEELTSAIKKVATEAPYYSNEVVSNVMSSFGQKKEPVQGTVEQLTKREMEMVQLIAEEYTMTEIADKLFISEHTVRSHRKNILHKLGVRNTAGLIKYAFQHGLVK